MSQSSTNWLQLVAATAVGAAVSYVVTREIDRRYPKKAKAEVEGNPEARMLEMLEELDDE